MTKHSDSDASAGEILEHYRDLTWNELKNYLQDPQYPQSFKIDKKYEKERDFHWQVVREYPERKGKYLRPTLVLLAAEAMGVDVKLAVRTASAMQICEEWCLVHDDFEDDSMERRGRPALHRIYGSEVAVNAGDHLHVIMWKILADNISILGEEKTSRLIDEFYRILSRTVIGQTVEIRWTKSGKFNLTDKEWFFIADGKTSYYTIAGPMRLGAIIAGATAKQLDILAKLGIYLGRCFQIIDDVLDITSDFNGLKKQQGNDIYEGKRTIILSHLFRTASSPDKKKLTVIMKKSRAEKTQKEVNWVVKKMIDYGSIVYARKVASGLKDRAFDIFNTRAKFLSRPLARKKLESLMAFILERNH